MPEVPRAGLRDRDDGVRRPNADLLAESEEQARSRAPLGAPVVEGVEGEDSWPQPKRMRQREQDTRPDGVYVDEVEVASGRVDQRQGRVGERLSVPSTK